MWLLRAGLHGFERHRVLVDGAFDAASVERNTLQPFGWIGESLDLGDGGFELAGLLLLDLGEKSVLHVVGALEPPTIGGDAFGEVLFDGADGGESFDDGAAVLLEGGVLAKEGGVDAGAESVTDCVLADGLFSGGGGRAGG